MVIGGLDIIEDKSFSLKTLDEFKTREENVWGAKYLCNGEGKRLFDFISLLSEFILQ